jgi:hypothetical protein
VPPYVGIDGLECAVGREVEGPEYSPDKKYTPDCGP